MGDTVLIRGMFYLYTPVSFTNCSKLLIDGGNLTWTGHQSVVLDCTNITINGFLQPEGDVIFGRHVRDTSVGPQGRLSFTAGGPVLTRTLAVSGTMEVRNKVSLQSPVQDQRKIVSLVVHGPGGRLRLDTHHLPMINNTLDVLTLNHSELFVQDLTVNGVFDADRLAFPERVTRVTVGNGGNFTFDPASALEVDYVTSHGVMTSLTPLNMSGNSVIRTRALVVGVNGTVRLDSRAQDSGDFSGVSYLVVEVVTVDGTMHAGRLINHHPPLVHGWNHLGVGPRGSLTFYPNDTFYLGYGEVAGVMESLTPVTIRRPPAYEVNENEFVVDSTGRVKLGVREATQMTNDVQVGKLGIRTGGTLDAGYQKPTPGSLTVSPLSLFNVSVLDVNGTLQGDSLHVLSDNVTVRGAITAAGGGFLSNAGPGE